MFDFNVGSVEIILEIGDNKIMKQDNLTIILSNNQLYFPKKSLHIILNHLNKDYVSEWIETGLRLGTIKNRLDEINLVFKTLLLQHLGNNLILFNPEDVERVINGCENWIMFSEKRNNGINIHVGGTQK